MFVSLARPMSVRPVWYCEAVWYPALHFGCSDAFLPLGADTQKQGGVYRAVSECVRIDEGRCMQVDTRVDVH